jgi:chromosome segregation ATPase
MDEIIFNTQMLGFDKQAVLDYIDQLNDARITREEEFRQQMEQLESEKAGVDAKADLLRQENARLAADMEELRQQNSQLEEKAAAADTHVMFAERLSIRERDNELLKSRITGLNEEIMRLKNQLAQKDATIAQMTAEAEEMRKMQEQLDEKGRKYDQLSGSVGVVVLEAQRAADAIIANANREAAAAVKEAEDTVAKVAEHLNSFRAEIGNIHAAMARTMESFESSVAGMEQAAHLAQTKLYGEEEAEINA